MYVCMYVCMYVYTHIYKCIHTHVDKFNRLVACTFQAPPCPQLLMSPALTAESQTLPEERVNVPYHVIMLLVVLL